MSRSDSNDRHAAGAPERDTTPVQPLMGGFDRETSVLVPRLTERCAGVACAIAVVALAGWALNARVLAWQWDGVIPMAPASAIALLGLAGGLFVIARWPRPRPGRMLARAGASLAALLGVLVLIKLTTGLEVGIEWTLARTRELFGGIPIGRMSPLTAALLILESAALLALVEVNRWRMAGTVAALLGLTATAISVVVVVGYAYGAPLLYGGATIPVALPTALAFVLVGIGEINLALPTLHVLRHWRGGSLRGRLLRAFLPGALLLVFVEGWLDNIFEQTRTMNPALWDSVTALVVCGLIVVFTAWIARGTGDDIENVKNALRESESRLRTITDSAQDAILMMDPEGRVSYWNPAAERIFGYSSDEALRRHIHELIVSPQYRPAFSAAFPVFQQTGQGVAVGRTLDLEARTKDGQDVAVQLSLSSVRLHDGWYGVGVVRDITEQRQAESERRQLEQQIQQAQKVESLGVLAGGIAHDFNNILTAVLGHADLALTALGPTSAARSSLNEISTAARRAAELSQQMLAYSGAASFTRERLNLNPILDGMQHLLRTTISSKAQLDLQLNRDLPAIHADPSQIRQIVLSLIVNASEAMSETPGVITVSTRMCRCTAADLQTAVVHDDRPPGTYAELTVKDTGCGMDAETQSRIFDPFFTTKFTGRGLGLAAVLGIVRAHKGVIRFESAPGRGSTFTVLFPAAKPQDDARSGDSTAPPAAGARQDAVRAADHGPAAPRADGQTRGTVLLVDDEEQLRTLGSRMLSRLGYTVLTAAGGSEAIATYRTQHSAIDVVILDLTMPEMDGAEVFDQLRLINPDVRVVLASGYSTADISERFANKGLCGVIQKPYTLDLLRRALSKATTGPDASAPAGSA
ncbi:MAG: PAS domain S-box protein [Acidobacteria bacterium]|nr:PAS domain S-box protein [Acidobacteriota bacterium]